MKKLTAALALAALAALLWLPGRVFTQSATISGWNQPLTLPSAHGFFALTPSTAVSNLIFSGGPSAIIGSIRAVIVAAIQRQSIGTWPHVPEESREVIAPRLAHEYPATSIVLEVSILRVVAPILSLAPRHVFRWDATMARGPMRQVQSARGFSPQTTARLRHSIHQAWAHHLMPTPTITSTYPSRMVIRLSSWCQLQDKQTSKPLPYQIAKCAHV